MPATASDRIRQHSARIATAWQARAQEEVAVVRGTSLALWDSLPEYLSQIADALSTTIDRTSDRVRSDRTASARVGKDHGRERAGRLGYTMDQLICEHHILRRVIFEVMEEDGPLSGAERDVIITSIEQAVNDAATQFSDTLREIGELLADTLTHDLRGPITSAKINAQMILKHPTNPALVARSATRISLGMDRLDAMIRDLLNASLLRAGEGLTLARLDCDLDRIAREVAGELGLSHGDHFRVVSAGPCVGHWNQEALRRTIENLASNAAKYGASATPITLTLSQTPSSATLSVHNEGRPIPTEERAALFQQFRRARSARDQVGWGIGLTLVKGMVEAHGGTVEVESAPGLGTTFRFEVPKRQAAVH